MAKCLSRDIHKLPSMTKLKNPCEENDYFYSPL